MAPIKTSLLSHRELAINFPNFSRNQLNYSVLNTFHLAPEMIQAMDKYHTTRINGRQFNALLHDGMITQVESTKGASYPNGNGIVNKSVDYQIIYSKCTPYQVKRAKELKLSFRKPADIWGIPPTVIVCIVIDMDGIKES